MSRMNVLVVDPWCEFGTNIYRYSTGLATGLSHYSNLTLSAPYSVIAADNLTFPVIYSFFKYSSRLNRSSFRKVVRGCEYVLDYFCLLHHVKRRHYDVIQIEWPLLYRFDYWIWKRIKKHCSLFVVKAHNVFPHSSGLKYYKQFNDLYSLGDIILVHGENIRKEFILHFPKYANNVRIQQYGTNMIRDISFSVDGIDRAIQRRIQNAKKVYLFFGDIHEDKGIDRLIKIWIDKFSETNSLLIVSGRVDQSFDSFVSLKEPIRNVSSIILLEGYIPDNSLNYLISSCDLVVLPYRKAYMSAVVFTCAEFKKTFLATDFGSVSEYAENGVDCFIVENDDCVLAEKLIDIDCNYSKDELSTMGDALNRNFNTKHNWDVIGKELVCEYMTTLNQRL